MCHLILNDESISAGFRELSYLKIDSFFISFEKGHLKAILESLFFSLSFLEFLVRSLIEIFNFNLIIIFEIFGIGSSDIESDYA